MCLMSTKRCQSFGEGSVDADDDAVEGNLFDRFICRSGLFLVPMLGTCQAAGKIKGVVAIMAALGVAKQMALILFSKMVFP